MQLGDCSLWQDMLYLMLSVSTDLTKLKSPDQKACCELVRGPFGGMFCCCRLDSVPISSRVFTEAHYSLFIPSKV